MSFFDFFSFYFFKSSLSYLFPANPANPNIPRPFSTSCPSYTTQPLPPSSLLFPFPMKAATLLCQTAARATTSHTTPFKVDVGLVKRLRATTQCALGVARSALASANNDYSQAIEIVNSALTSSAKSDKLASRPTTQGSLCVAIHPLGLSASIVDLRCESDFVARNSIFASLASRIAASALVYQGNVALDAPLAPADLAVNPGEAYPSLSDSASPTVLKDALNQAISVLGENMALHRVAYLPSPFTADPTSTTTNALSFTFTSGTTHPSPPMGRIAALVSLEITTSPTKTQHQPQPQKQKLHQNLTTLATHLSKQIIGTSPSNTQDLLASEFMFSTAVIYQSTEVAGTPTTASSSKTVGEILEVVGVNWGACIRVKEFLRWEVGEELSV